jgi:exopolyphosphatase / guanosine-5'-triphosphate,3'-diphosphate pyrophosphatase
VQTSPPTHGRPAARAPHSGGPLTVFLVRHAKALKRSRWDGPERLRPVTRSGHEQARRIAALLEEARVERVVSSPFLRCRQTLEPLAATRGLPLEIDERLAEGERIDKALDLLGELDARSTAICSHGSVIPALLCELEERGARLEDELRCEKGSIWVLRGPEEAPRASYVPPPAKGRREALEGLGADAPDASEEEPEESRVAVLDLGSTSFHLLVAEAAADGAMRRILRERIMLRLGAFIAIDGRIPEDVCARAAETARELRRVAAQAGAERLLPVATAALRDAANGREVASRIADAIDAPVRILDGQEEARLMFASFARRVSLGPGLALGIDLGGGSLELAIGDARGVRWETTLPLGVARLHGELGGEDPMPKKVARAVRERTRAQLAPHLATIAELAPRNWVTSGGTIGALARRVTARRGLRPTRSINELFVPRAEFEALCDELVRSSHAERLRTPGVQRRRADLLPTGALVLATLAEELDIEGFTVCDWGLREGVILEWLGLARA